jgi:arylsulfatase A-like enzyme
MRRLWLLPCLTILACHSLAAAERPNVVIVMTDDQGYGDHSAHGNPVLKTPNLDRLREQSIRLTDFHVAPMCTPTRGQLMTGCDCLRNGAMNVSSGRTLLRRGFPTMPDIFKANGYRTGQFGKWHLGDNYPYRPQDRGFEETLWFPSSHIGSAPDFFTNDYFDDVYSQNGERKPFSGYCTDVFFNNALDWMKKRAAANEPFFCYLPTNAPHGPLHVPAKYREEYEAKGQKENVARFFGMIANIDENVGRLLSFLKDSGLEENTILIYLTDNGGTAGVPIFNAGMRGRKIELYEGGHRVPCFIRWPAGKLREPGDIAELTEVQDLLPTIAELCNLDLPEQAKFDGISLASLLRGEIDALPDRSLVIQFSRMNAPVPHKGDACVAWKRWRLVGDKELYDLAADFEQRQNVLDRHPDVAERLRKDYDAWWSEIAPHVNDHSAIIVGSDHENPSLLSPADWEDVFLDQAQQVRAGLRRNGPWNIEVAQPGTYEISLRRWPQEDPAPISAGKPPMSNDDGAFPKGVALPIASARLKVGDFDATQRVQATDESVAFEVKLAAGRTDLQTWFLDETGSEIAGAYYVTVLRK